MNQQRPAPGTPVSTLSNVFVLIRPDGSEAFEASNEQERAETLAPRNWKWEARSYWRTGHIGPHGGFVETSRKRIA